MEREELCEILRKHEMWLKNHPGGRRANLSGANLSGADLSCADLSGADLRCANLSGANLSGANLSNASLSYANLSGANLSYANLSVANLSCADLSGADISDADLSGADISGADLRCANIDYSCLPLWCGSLSANFDDKQIIQIVYHAVKAGLSSKNVSDDVKHNLKGLANLANRFHRINECGKIELK